MGRIKKFGLDTCDAKQSRADREGQGKGQGKDRGKERERTGKRQGKDRERTGKGQGKDRERTGIHTLRTFDMVPFYE